MKDLRGVRNGCEIEEFSVVSGLVSLCRPCLLSFEQFTGMQMLLAMIDASAFVFFPVQLAEHTWHSE